ncbi:MAG: hypothetical protein WCL29_08240, partial [Pseudomonadota bacterium]
MHDQPGSNIETVSNKETVSNNKIGHAPAESRIAVSAKSAALAALAHLHQTAPFEPVARINYQSNGRLLVIGSDARVADAVALLQTTLSPAVFWSGKTTAPDIAGAEVSQGEIISLSGF